MRIFIGVFFVILFTRECLSMWCAMTRDNYKKMLWHFCWIIPLCFFAKYLGILLEG